MFDPANLHQIFCDIHTCTEVDCNKQKRSTAQLCEACDGAMVLYHGTTIEAAQQIMKDGHLAPSKDGIFGAGVYLTSSKKKAAAWATYKANGSPTFLEDQGERAWNDPVGAVVPPGARFSSRVQSNQPVVIKVSCVLGKCKTFDMGAVKDSDYFYAAYHRPYGGYHSIRRDEDGVGLRDSSHCGDTSSYFREEEGYTQGVADDFGRLLIYSQISGCSARKNPQWSQRPNGCKQWGEEGFDSQYVPDTWPNGPATLDLWPGSEERMIGDEYVVADGARVRYISHEVVPFTSTGKLLAFYEVVLSCPFGFDPKKVTIDKAKELGHGTFGITYVGTVRGQPAAVKVLELKKPRAGESARTAEEEQWLKMKGVKAMRKEITAIRKVAKFGSHPNLIKVLAIDDFSADPKFALELCTGGTVLAMAKASKPAAGQPHNMAYFAKLDRFALELASGMACMEKNKLVHRDLRCRNLLLDEKGVLKIADFGLARNEDELKEEFHSPETAQTHWKWTAPEGNEDDFYVLKSDVWSYGIALAEMCQYGDKPYKDPRWRQWSPAFNEWIREGNTHDIRPHWPSLLQMVMRLCWKLAPEDRPTFDQIYKTLRGGISGAGGSEE